ncbi:hypothetical protein PQR08_25270 [Caballeronia jiangsuensis]|uniref:Lipoprotein n=1 Tax=Caballeronia jiangsuensis TaxID=1458357 RepID=A0ABW9CQW5_9BURK
MRTRSRYEKFGILIVLGGIFGPAAARIEDCLDAGRDMRSSNWQELQNCENSIGLAPKLWEVRCEPAFGAKLAQISADVDECVRQQNLRDDEKQKRDSDPRIDGLFKLIDKTTDHISPDPIVERIIKHNFEQLKSVSNALVHKMDEVSTSIATFHGGAEMPRASQQRYNGLPGASVGSQRAPEPVEGQQRYYGLPVAPVVQEGYPEQPPPVSRQQHPSTIDALQHVPVRPPPAAKQGTGHSDVAVVRRSSPYQGGRYQPPPATQSVPGDARPAEVVPQHRQYYSAAQAAPQQAPVRPSPPVFQPHYSAAPVPPPSPRPPDPSPAITPYRYTVPGTKPNQ